MATTVRVMSGIVSRTGAAPRLFRINKCMHAVHRTPLRTRAQTQHSDADLGTGKIICAILLPTCFSLFFFSFCLTPAVTQSNPQPNDGSSLTLIKGGQLTAGLGVTFIRRLVKVFFSLALNKSVGRQDGYLEVVVDAVEGRGGGS